MPRTPSTPSVSILNALAFLALLVTLYPTGGKLPEKPAGYRTALELLDKRGQSGGSVLVAVDAGSMV